MNCSQGEIARIVPRRPELEWTRGRIVTCTRLVELGEAVKWAVEPRLAMPDGRGWIVALPDSWLRPLRDPGDDERDETLTWRPVPRETAKTHQPHHRGYPKPEGA